MQQMLELLEKNCSTYSILCNTKKTLCMVFNPKCVSKVVSLTFPPLTLCGVKLQFVTKFKYLGHIINNRLSDSHDSERQINNLFVRCNMLRNRFNLCSTAVKCVLFKTYCLCFYNIALWRNYRPTITCLNSLKASYHKCIKKFFWLYKNRQYDRHHCLLETT